MTHTNEQKNLDLYKHLLDRYVHKQNEQTLYQAVKLSKTLLEKDIPPEEVINLHFQAMKHIFPNLPPEIHHSMDFLLEVMISYGLDYQKTHQIKDEQSKLQAELEIAANMQQTLLAIEKPRIDQLDIGVISVPAGQMNGDFYHFVKNENGQIGIALADVIGKGVPAALCMLMIKYALDSFPKDIMAPKKILKNLNRVVEQNVEPGMFITMFYGQYLPEISLLRYASAGHEPGVYFSRSSGAFTDLKAKGLVLGVLPHSIYEQYEVKILPGDMIILFTDGVTECRCGENFIERTDVLNIIKQYIDLPAQETVEHVYKYFERLQDFQLEDDFTLLIIKRNV